MARPGEGGFTLIEALVALAVLAVGAVSLLAATEAHVGRVAALADRAAARWVAADHLTALRLGLDPPEVSAMMGAEWGARAERAPTSDPALERVTVRVGPAGSEDVLAVLTGFVDLGPEADPEADPDSDPDPDAAAAQAAR